MHSGGILVRYGTVRYGTGRVILSSFVMLFFLILA